MRIRAAVAPAANRSHSDIINGIVGCSGGVEGSVLEMLMGDANTCVHGLQTLRLHIRWHGVSASVRGWLEHCGTRWARWFLDRVGAGAAGCNRFCGCRRTAKTSGRQPPPNYSLRYGYILRTHWKRVCGWFSGGWAFRPVGDPPVIDISMKPHVDRMPAHSSQQTTERPNERDLPGCEKTRKSSHANALSRK